MWHTDLIAPQHVGMLAPQPGIEPVPPALEGRVLTAGPPAKYQRMGFVLFCFFSLSFNLLATLSDMWDLGSLTRGPFRVPCIGR